MFCIRGSPVIENNVYPYAHSIPIADIDESITLYNLCRFIIPVNYPLLDCRIYFQIERKTNSYFKISITSSLAPNYPIEQRTKSAGKDKNKYRTYLKEFHRNKSHYKQSYAHSKLQRCFCG